MKLRVLPEPERRKMLKVTPESKQPTAIEALPGADSLELEKLIREVMKQNRLALVTLFDRVSTPLYSLALTMLGKEEDACEVLHETFSWIWLHARKFNEHRGNAFSWLVALVRQRSLVRVRKTGLSDALIKYCETILAEVDPGHKDPNETWNFKIRRALRSLPEEEQRVLKMAFFSGFNPLEIAEKYDVPAETIRQYAYQGMARLHQAIGRPSV